MAYEINAVCTKCDKKAEVPEVGACPMEWAQLRYVPRGHKKPVTAVLCSINCLVEHIGEMMEQSKED